MSADRPPEGARPAAAGEGTPARSELTRFDKRPQQAGRWLAVMAATGLFAAMLCAGMAGDAGRGLPLPERLFDTLAIAAAVLVFVLSWAAERVGRAAFDKLCWAYLLCQLPAALVFTLLAASGSLLPESKARLFLVLLALLPAALSVAALWRARGLLLAQADR